MPTCVPIMFLYVCEFVYTCVCVARFDNCVPTCICACSRVCCIALFLALLSLEQSPVFAVRLRVFV